MQAAIVDAERVGVKSRYNAMMASHDANARHLFVRHDRNWRTNRYVYPVCSRRAGGISIGVNVNLDCRCTFNCVYCQVDRRSPVRGPTEVDLDVLRAELAAMLGAAADGSLLAEPEFASLPDSFRRVNDVAFSGDGEPTAFPRFGEAVELAERAIVAAGLDAKLVLITNATLFGQPQVQAALDAMHVRNGEIWAKLDAGTEEAFARIARSVVPFQRVLNNVAWAARRYPIVIQSCFMRLYGLPPTAADVETWCDRLEGIVAGRGRIKLVQVYTVARRPAEDYVSPLSAGEVDAIVARVCERLPELAAKAFYGPA